MFVFEKNYKNKDYFTKKNFIDKKSNERFEIFSYKISIIKF